MTWRANPDLVAEAWLKGVAGIDSANVGSDLPEDNTTWAASGFVQVAGVKGGSPALYVPQRLPVVQVDLWAVNPNSGLPPWNKAAQLAEIIIADTYLPSTGTGGNRDVTAHLPSGYGNVYVQSVYPLSEPRQIPGDAGSYAHLTMDLQMAWVQTS